jgi:hypothetical protein
MMTAQPIQASLGLAFDLDFKDADGNVLKTIQCKASIPLSELGLTPDSAQALIDEQESQHGDHRTE